MTSSPHGPYALGDTRVTMVRTMGGEVVRRSKSFKARPSSDRGLQFALVKPESLVMAHQNGAVNTFPGLVHTARQALKVENARSMTEVVSRWNPWLALSRNKVAVRERAAGSPPFLKLQKEREKMRRKTLQRLFYYLY